jgi:hypothetical protein
MLQRTLPGRVVRFDGDPNGPTNAPAAWFKPTAKNDYRCLRNLRRLVRRHNGLEPNEHNGLDPM